MGVLVRRVRPKDWTPIGVEELEANAMSVVRSTENRSVVAGPGAGKTELLAQRAAYLLQTGGGGHTAADSRDQLQARRRVESRRAGAQALSSTTCRPI